MATKLFPTIHLSPAIATMALGSASASYSLLEKIRIAALHSFKGVEVYFGCLEAHAYATTGVVNHQSLLQAAMETKKDCNQNGIVSALQVNVQNSQAITTTLAFVQKYSIRMVVKNTGHDHLGRSSAADTLVLSTKQLENMPFKSSFTVQNSPTAGNKQNITIIGAGANAETATGFFDKYNIIITIGDCALWWALQADLAKAPAIVLWHPLTDQY